MKTSLIVKAVEMAQRRVPIIPGKTIFHSDYAEVFIKPRNQSLASIGVAY